MPAPWREYQPAATVVPARPAGGQPSRAAEQDRILRGISRFIPAELGSRFGISAVHIR
jgi:hypothetical protein